MKIYPTCVADPRCTFVAPTHTNREWAEYGYHCDWERGHAEFFPDAPYLSDRVRCSPLPYTICTAQEAR